MSNDNTNENSRLNEEAAYWLLRLDEGQLSDPERDAFEDWFFANPTHAEAFDRARRAWRDLGRVDEGRVRARVPVRRKLRRHALQVLAASIALVFALGAWHVMDPLTVLKADYRTGFGEVRDARLSDGSTVHLNTDSAIAVAYDAESRSITLLKGEVAFDVAPTENGEVRPFVVKALGGAARALGTRYSVRIDGTRVRVAVSEHAVAVSPPHDGAGRTTDVGEGESIVYSAAGALGPITKTDAETEGAWQRGRLVFDRRPLGEVVAELNRYRVGRIVIARDALATKRVSGVFHLDDLSRAVDVIADELDATAVSLPPLVTMIF